MSRSTIVVACLSSLLLLSGCRMIRLISLVKSSRQQREASPLSDRVAIPFAYEGDWITLKVAVRQGSRETVGDFLFDTGAFTRLFDSTGAVDVMRPERVARMPVQGAFGTIYRELRLARNVSLLAGRLVIEKPLVIVGERPAMFPKSWLGIIGADFFHRYALTVDFKDTMIYVQPADSFDKSGWNELKIKAIGNHNPIVRDLRLSDLPAGDYLVDLGNSGSVLVQSASESSLKAAMGSRVREYAVSGSGATDAGGRIAFSRYFSKSADHIDGRRCRAFEIAGLAGKAGPGKYGNLGLGFLSQVFEALTIDWTRGRMFYKLSQLPDGEPFDREVYFHEEGGRFLTGAVLLGSPWYAQGLRPGMEVRSINGRDPAAYMADRKAARASPLDRITFKSAASELTITRNP